jgi:hypothetical protein
MPMIASNVDSFFSKKDGHGLGPSSTQETDVRSMGLDWRAATNSNSKTVCESYCLEAVGSSWQFPIENRNTNPSDIWKDSTSLVKFALLGGDKSDWNGTGLLDPHPHCHTSNTVRNTYFLSFLMHSVHEIPPRWPHKLDTWRMFQLCHRWSLSAVAALLEAQSMIGQYHVDMWSRLADDWQNECIRVIRFILFRWRVLRRIIAVILWHSRYFNVIITYGDWHFSSSDEQNVTRCHRQWRRWTRISLQTMTTTLLLPNERALESLQYPMWLGSAMDCWGVTRIIHKTANNLSSMKPSLPTWFFLQNGCTKASFPNRRERTHFMKMLA